MTQQSLFDDKPAAKARERRTDPPSSHEAADQVNASGEARRQREHVIDLVFMHPGRTSKELAAMTTELDRFQIARRLPEAEREGHVRSEKQGKQELRWYPHG